MTATLGMEEVSYRPYWSNSRTKSPSLVNITTSATRAARKISESAASR